MQPLQIDLTHLILPSPADGSPEALTQLALKLLLSNQVAAIYHVAGYVDTRESPDIRRRLCDVNTRVTSALASMASACEVMRFVHVSSAAAVHTKLPSSDAHIPFYFRCSVMPLSFRIPRNRSCQVAAPSIHALPEMERQHSILPPFDVLGLEA